MEKYQEKYEEWVNNPIFDEETKKALLEMKGNETEKKDFKLGISLYDENDTLLLEKTKEYKKEDITSILEDAEVFPLNETLKLDAIKKYSINITE